MSSGSPARETIRRSPNKPQQQILCDLAAFTGAVFIFSTYHWWTAATVSGVLALGTIIIWLWTGTALIPEKSEKDVPKAFRTSQVTVISKLDLLPYVPFSVERAIEDVRRVQPEMQFFPICALTGEGLDAWCEYLVEERRHVVPDGGR